MFSTYSTCDKCMHKNVCSIKNQVQNTIGKLCEIDSSFVIVSVTCKEYMRDK